MTLCRPRVTASSIAPAALPVAPSSGKASHNRGRRNDPRKPPLELGTEMTGLEMKYFVLKPKGGDAYAAASRKAMRTYATMIKQENPELAKELREWADSEQFRNAAENPIR